MELTGDMSDSRPRDTDAMFRRLVDHTRKLKSLGDNNWCQLPVPIFILFFIVHQSGGVQCTLHEEHGKSTVRVQCTCTNVYVFNNDNYC